MHCPMTSPSDLYWADGVYWRLGIALSVSPEPLSPRSKVRELSRLYFAIREYASLYFVALLTRLYYRQPHLKLQLVPN